eukprot:COSAG02_NODE_1611_length_11677_cov_2.985662_6_plen_85_part_00
MAFPFRPRIYTLSLSAVARQALERVPLTCLRLHAHTTFDSGLVLPAVVLFVIFILLLSIGMPQFVGVGDITRGAPRVFVHSCRQ